MRETLLTAGGHRTARASVVDEGVVVQGYRTRSQARRARLREPQAVPAPQAPLVEAPAERLAS